MVNWDSFQMFQEIWSAKVVGDLLVQAGDDLVNGLFPAGLGIFASLDSFEELAHGLRYYIHELRWNLDRRSRRKTNK